MKVRHILFSFITGISSFFLHCMEPSHKSDKQSRLDPKMQALFYFAARQGNKELIDSCIKKEVNVNSRDITGTSPLALALKSGNVKAVSALIGYGASVDAHDVTKEKILELFKNYPLLCDVLYNNSALLGDTRNHDDALIWTAFTIAISQGRSLAFQILFDRYSLPNDGLVRFAKLVLRIRKTASLTDVQRAHYQAIKDILIGQIYEQFPLLNRQTMD